jgi:hypothetical protein
MRQSAINIFISRPTKIGLGCEVIYEAFEKFLVSEGFKLRRLGGNDFSRKAPLRAVIGLIDKCGGALVLGYPQIEFYHETKKSTEMQNSVSYVFPTPWNQIEGALAYSRNSPVLVIAHPGISGGVFDHGITGEGVLHIDLSAPGWFQSEQFRQPFEEWAHDVRNGASGNK